MMQVAIKQQGRDIEVIATGHEFRPLIAVSWIHMVDERIGRRMYRKFRRITVDGEATIGRCWMHLVSEGSSGADDRHLREMAVRHLLEVCDHGPGPEDKIVSTETFSAPDMARALTALVTQSNATLVAEGDE